MSAGDHWDRRMSRHMAPLLWVTHVNMAENIITKIPVDVWVVDSCSEGKFWGFKGGICAKRHRLELKTSIRSREDPQNDNSLP